jgi:hypothetical protein
MPPGALDRRVDPDADRRAYRQLQLPPRRPLVSEDTVRGVQPAEQFTQYSSPAAKGLAQFASDLPLVHSNFGWSPAVIDNYITQWGGVMGRTAANAQPRPRQPKQSPAGATGVRLARHLFMGGALSQRQRGADPAILRHDDQAHAGARLAPEANPRGQFRRLQADRRSGRPFSGGMAAAEPRQNIPPGVDLGPYLGYLAQASQGADYQNLSLAHQAADALKNARDYSWSVYEDHNKTGHDKRQILDMTNAQMQVIAERGNEAMDRALIGVKRPGRSAQVPVPDSIYFPAMSKPPKFVIPGLNRGSGVPGGYYRRAAKGAGPAQLLDLIGLRAAGVATRS